MKQLRKKHDKIVQKDLNKHWIILRISKVQHFKKLAIQKVEEIFHPLISSFHAYF